MAEMAIGIRRSRRLSSRIATRLAIAALVAALLEILIVFALYSADRQKLAEQLLSHQAQKVSAIIAAEGLDPKALQAMPRPLGASDWGFAIHGLSGRTEFLRPSASSLPLPRPDGSIFTARIASDATPIVGVRLASVAGQRRWIAMSIVGDDRAMFAPVFFNEAVDHVILPLVPLILVLLVANIFIVRRALAPLATAAAEVEQLDPAGMDLRLTTPADNDEVGAMVAAVNRALDRLQQSMATLQDFTADAAHEMRTPLAVLRLRADALKPGPIKDQLVQDIAAMTRLVSQMLDLARADTLDIGNQDEIDLADLARDVVAQMAPLAYSRGCTIGVEESISVRVRGHREALVRALINLIDNALAHSPTGGAIEVRVGPGVRIAVRDHGPGLSEETASNLFRRFWRGQSQKEHGAGLGLAIVERIVTKHSGAISAANAADGGAVFTISWPD